MLSGELTGYHYLTAESLIPAPANLDIIHATLPNFQFSKYMNDPPYDPQFSFIAAHEFTPKYSSQSNNSTSDEAEEQQVRIIDERKQRRMISNRESARRSRMRKQRHLDELWSQVMRLRNEKHSLINKLNHMSENYDRAQQENARLKEETSDLRQMLTDLKVESPFTVALRELENVPSNTAHLRDESTATSTSSSVALLH